MSKFKIGDKVKILSTSVVDCISNHGVEIGMVGEVVDVDECGANIKHKNFKWGLWSFNDCDLELVEDFINNNPSSPFTMVAMMVALEISVVLLSRFNYID